MSAINPPPSTQRPATMPMMVPMPMEPLNDESEYVPRPMYPKKKTKVWIPKAMSMPAATDCRIGRVGVNRRTAATKPNINTARGTAAESELPPQQEQKLAG